MKTFVVIGLGRFGSAVARKLFEMGHEVLVIDDNEAAVQKISSVVTHAVAADAKDPNTLKALGIRNYDCAILAIAENIEDSVLITLALKDLGIREVVCKARDAQHKKILEKLGADRVIIPEYEMGLKTAVKLGSENLLDFIELSDNYGISEIKVPSKWIGQGIAEIDIRKKYKINVIAVKNECCKEVTAVPGPEYIFKENDILVIMGKNENINSFHI